MNDTEEPDWSGMVAMMIWGTGDLEDLGRRQRQDDCMGLFF